MARRFLRLPGRDETLTLWQVWKLGGNNVITIPAVLANYIKPDAAGQKWLVAENRVLGEFHFRMLTPEELEVLSQSPSSEEEV